MRKTFWKKSHNAYYCEFDRQQIRLKADKETAFQEYHILLAGRQPVTSRTTVRRLVDDFLAWTKQRRAESTYEWYPADFQSFVDFVGPKLTISELKPFHVSRWIDHAYDSHPLSI